MMFQNFSSLEEMHLEITNRCNAACPMCARNHFGGRDKEDLTSSEWTIEDAQKVFDSRFRSLRNLLFCGTHGDPAVAKNALEIIEIARAQTKATIEFYSNGSIRSKDWWTELGKILKHKVADDYYRKNDLAIFSIDGLEDTNHLYRRRTHFPKIIENAQAFIQAGGFARWDYIVFRHNEHQVEKAEALAKQLGFKQFRVRKTSRFAYSPDGPEKHRVLSNSGQIEYYLEPTTLPEYSNQNKKKYENIVGTENSKDFKLNKKIQCLNKSQFQRLYINAYLNVFPCCFISNDTYPGAGKVFKDTKTKVIERYGSSFNSLKMQSWGDILEHEWFSQKLVTSWENSEEKLIRCQRTCSVDCNPITSQSEDRIISNPSNLTV